MYKSDIYGDLNVNPRKHYQQSFSTRKLLSKIQDIILTA